MIVELLLRKFLDRGFLFPLVAASLTYLILRIVRDLIVRRRRHQLFKYYGIPGPKTNILDGNYTAYKSEPFNDAVEQKFHDTYGNVFGTFIGDEPTIVTTDLDILKRVFLYENKNFRLRSAVFIDSALSKGLFFASHDRWKIMRRMMTPAFNKFTTRYNSNTEHIEESVSLTLNYIERKIREKQAAGKFLLDIQSLMKSTALHLISALAIKLPNVQVRENDEYVENLDQFMESLDSGVILWAIRFPVLTKLVEFLANNFVYDKVLYLIRKNLNRMIDEGPKRAKKENSNRIIDLLVRMYHAGKVSRIEVIGNAETILIAGYDTTSTTLTYAFWAISRYAEVQRKLREELMVYGSESEYLEQILWETMRLYPTLTSFSTRLCTNTVKIKNVTIPQGCIVVHNTWLLHRSPELWPDPLKFDPSRFRKGIERHPCAYAPFGLGDRKCLGYKLAMLEMKMIICDVVLRYKLTLVSPKEMDFKTHGVVLSAPKEKVILTLDSVQ